MKALLLKDAYMIRKYCRMYLIMVVIFLVVAMSSTENVIFLVYPCLLAGLLPMTMLAYDENSKWDRYCAALPFTREQQVTAKYMLGFILIVCMSLVCLAAVLIRQAVTGTVSFSSAAQQLLIVLTTALMAPAVSLPLAFKFGVEKGRAARLVVIGVICALAVTVPDILKVRTENAAPWVGPVILLVTLALYVISWRLSVVLYRHREL